MVAGTPVGLLLSLIGLMFDRRKTAALLGLLLSGGIVALFLVSTLCR